MARLARKSYGQSSWCGRYLSKDEVSQKREWCRREVEALTENVKAIESSPNATKRELNLAKRWRTEIVHRVEDMGALTWA